MEKLADKVAVITGSSRGIGRSIALRLAAEGAFVVIHYAQRKDEAEAVVQQIVKAGGEACAIGSDFSTLAGIQSFYSKLDVALQERNGNTTFDILVNNAGIGQVATLEETSETSFDDVMDLNVKSPFFVTQQALPRLTNGGRIINISSYVTRVASPNVFTYSLSKGAIDTFTLMLAQQLGERKITVNAIQPGVINTEMNADTYHNPAGQKQVAELSVFGRWGEPEDIAGIAAFLASEDSRWVTGQLIDASGGTQL